VNVKRPAGCVGKLLLERINLWIRKMKEVFVFSVREDNPSKNEIDAIWRISIPFDRIDDIVKLLVMCNLVLHYK
jgi:hypothetical protein